MGNRKKVTKKKVSKASPKRAVPAEASEEEVNAAVVIDEMTDEEVDDVINPELPPMPNEAPVMKASEDAEDGEKMVKINIPVQLKINRKRLGPGLITVPKHQAAQVLDMVHKKRRADISIYTGKNFIQERILDRALIIKEVDDINLAELVK